MKGGQDELESRVGHLFACESFEQKPEGQNVAIRFDGFVFRFDELILAHIDLSAGLVSGLHPVVGCCCCMGLANDGQQQEAEQTTTTTTTTLNKLRWKLMIFK